jgi:DNA-binding IclR family transcriptional regulator
VKNPPAYGITSVDNALRMATVLQLEGSLSVSEAADRLEVARSTAHRLLGMLCYRDFAVQGDDRRYHPGPVLAPHLHSTQSSALLRATALPHLAALTDAADETSNLTVMSGSLVRFLASVECQQVLRVGTREGMAFPAHQTSGGLAMLAQLPDPDITELFTAAGGETPVLPALRKQLGLVRERGFAINDGRTETGIVAIGVAVLDARGTAIAGLSLSMPSTRFSRDRIPALVGHLRAQRDAIERSLPRAAETP